MIIDEKKTSGGKGKKYCVQCKNYVAARCLKCPHCNYEFKIGEKYEPPKIKSTEELEEEAYCKGLGLKGRPVYTPSGSCPIPLLQFDHESVLTWCEEVVDEGYSIKQVYFPSCLIYWLRNFVDVNSSEYHEIKSYINQWANDIIQAFK